MELGHRPAFENTYRLEPREIERYEIWIQIFRFYPSKVKSCIEEVVLRNLKDKEYDHATAKLMAETIADQIKMQVKALNIPSYKIVVQTVIGEITGQGVRVASKCLWDD